MLQEKVPTIGKDEVIVINMATGQLIVARCNTVTDKNLIVNKPMQIVQVQGSQNMTLQDYMHGGDRDKPAFINMDAVVSYSHALPTLASEYTSITSGIVVAPKSKLIV